ncbi:hypothetical protein D3C84_516150 [compost metagenome]
MVATRRVGAAVEVALQRVEAGALAGAHVGRQLGALGDPVVAVQLAPLPGLAVGAEPAFGIGDGGRQAAREDRRFVFLLRGADVIPERAVDAAQQMVGLGRVGQVGGLHQGAPGGAGFRPQFVEEDLPRALVEEGAVVGGVRRGGAEAAVEGLQAVEGLLGPGPVGGRQCIDGLLQRLGHARVLQHGLEFGDEGAGLVVLHGDHALPVVLAAAGQFSDAFGTFRVVPGVGQLHPVAALDGAVVGGAEPALGRVLVVGVEHGVGVAVPVIAAVPARGGQQAAAFATVRVAAGDLPGDVLGVRIENVQAHGANGAGRLVGVFHRLGTGQGEEGVQGLVGLELAGLQGDSQAALDLQRLQRVLALAQHRV